MVQGFFTHTGRCIVGAFPMRRGGKESFPTWEYLAPARIR